MAIMKTHSPYRDQTAWYSLRSKYILTSRISWTRIIYTSMLYTATYTLIDAAFSIFLRLDSNVIAIGTAWYAIPAFIV